MPIETTGEKALFNPGGHLSEEGIALYVDALRLDTLDELPERLAAHVAECPSCKGEALDVYEVTAGQTPVDTALHPYFGRQKPLRKAISPSVLRWAAVIVVGVGIAGSYFYWSSLRHRDIGQKEGSSAAPPASEAPSRNYATNYEPLPGLEGLVGASFRGGSIQVASPALGENVRDSVSFRWGGERGVATTVSVLTNRGIEIARFVSRNGSANLRQELEPGLYYWKLECEGNLEYVGKFYVR